MYVDLLPECLVKYVFILIWQTATLLDHSHATEGGQDEHKLIASRHQSGIVNAQQKGAPIGLIVQADDHN
jgi:hypothetical protein